MKAEIVKVQQPLSSTEADPPWLIYAKGHDRQQMLPKGAIPSAVVKAMGHDARAFFKAHYSSVVGWAINERVKDQDW